MFQQSSPADLSNVPLAVARVIQHLSRLVPGKMDRNAFFKFFPGNYACFSTMIVSASISMTRNGNS